MSDVADIVFDISARLWKCNMRVSTHACKQAIKHPQAHAIMLTGVDVNRHAYKLPRFSVCMHADEYGCMQVRLQVWNLQKDIHNQQRWFFDRRRSAAEYVQNVVFPKIFNMNLFPIYSLPSKDCHMNRHILIFCNLLQHRKRNYRM
jgi:hypothetical protein